MFEGMEDSSILAVVLFALLIWFALLFNVIKWAIKAASREQVELLKQQNALLMTMLENKEQEAKGVNEPLIT